MSSTLLAVPNLTVPNEESALKPFREALRGKSTVVLNQSYDADHGRSVHSLAGKQGTLAADLAQAIAAVTSDGDLRDQAGVHPYVGLVDVAPIVYVHDEDRGAACAEALVLANLVGKAGIPVFLYGELSGGRSRSDLRRGGLEGLIARAQLGELMPDFGPAEITSKIGATLVGARAPLIAFNVVLSSDSNVDDARAVASTIRDGGEEGLPGVRALGLELSKQGLVQVSMNLERPYEAGPREVFEAISARVKVDHGELIGLAPSRVIASIPDALAMPGLDPDLQSIEGSLRFNSIEI